MVASEAVKLRFSPMDEDAARQIITWRYAPPYDIYNETGDPKEAVQYLLDPANRLYRIDDDEEGVLAAFCSFGEDARVSGGDYSQDALDLGLGMNPALAGRGMGSLFVAAQMEYALQHFHPRALRVTVASFNLRAHRVWEKAGFQPTQSFRNKAGTRDFIIMTLDIPPSG